MASAVLASHNESSWGQSGGGFMGKLPYSNHLNPNPKSKPKPKPKPNPVPKKKKLHAIGGQVNGRPTDDSPAVTQTASDDAYSFNQRSMESNSRVDFNHGGYISFNISSYTRGELIELKKRLAAELEQIRRLNDRIESGTFQPRSQGGGGQLPGKSKKLSGNKRPIPFVSTEDPKRFFPTTSDSGIANGNEIGNLMKMCRQVLTKLMKNKNSWIFNKPVDVVSWGLHDYHQIIKHPMDLGTVKSKFGKNLYTSPGDFAADVRLTFNNALLYNPKGDEVHKMAEQLLARFEELYRPIEEKYEADQRDQHVVSDELQGGSWTRIPSPVKKKLKPNSTAPTPKKREKMQMAVAASNPSSSNLPLAQSPEHGESESRVRQTPPSPVQAQPVKPPAGRANPVKQPKPRAKDPDKRPMSMEEKHKLGVGLQSLPQEKMPQLVQIIRKRNEHMAQEGDEIELDIEAIDTETLWELDRFVTNWKKMVSKNKRQALMMNNSVAAAASGEDNLISASEKPDTFKKPKKGEAGEEDVDIGDEMPMSSFPPVEIEKDDGGGHDNGHASSSSGSSSSSSSDSSSSSSDSDSGSSSGSDSDADDAQSRGLESKEFSKT